MKLSEEIGLTVALIQQLQHRRCHCHPLPLPLSLPCVCPDPIVAESEVLACARDSDGVRGGSC
jgi:hypothetical protein